MWTVTVLLEKTAQKSDLTYRAMQISRARMNLSKNQQDIAKEYSDAVTNQRLEVRLDDQYVNLTPKTLMDAGYGFKFNGREYTSYDEEDIKEIFGSSTEGVGEDDNIFQRYLMEGRIVLLEPKEGTEDDYMEISYSGTNDINTKYNTEDDAAAKAKYDLEMSKLQTKDKMLELDLDRIQTELQVVTTEIETIKDLVEKNIEDSFSTFKQS